MRVICGQGIGAAREFVHAPSGPGAGDRRSLALRKTLIDNLHTASDTGAVPAVTRHDIPGPTMKRDKPAAFTSTLLEFFAKLA